MAGVRRPHVEGGSDVEGGAWETENSALTVVERDGGRTWVGCGEVGWGCVWRGVGDEARCTRWDGDEVRLVEVSLTKAGRGAARREAPRAGAASRGGGGWGGARQATVVIILLLLLLLVRHYSW